MYQGEEVTMKKLAIATTVFMLLSSSALSQQIVSIDRQRIDELGALLCLWQVGLGALSREQSTYDVRNLVLERCKDELDAIQRSEHLHNSAVSLHYVDLFLRNYNEALSDLQRKAGHP